MVQHHVCMYLLTLPASGIPLSDPLPAFKERPRPDVGVKQI